MSRITGSAVLVTLERRHTPARTSAIASHRPASVAGTRSWRNARYSVESDGTGPNRRFDVRARLAAPGKHQHRLDQHLAPLMQR